MKLLACQIAVPAMTEAQERDDHLGGCADLVAAALGQAPADLVVLPELSAIDYSRSAFERLDRLAEDLAGPSYRTFAELARRHGTTLVYGFARRTEDGRYTICQAAVGPDGSLIGYFDKLHPAHYGASMEKDYFVAGQRLLVFEVAGLRVAPVICYDLRFPELWRRLALDEEVDLILHPVAFYRDLSAYSWRAFAIARALESQIYLLSLNRAGPDWGGSIFCPPWVDEAERETVLGTAEECRAFDVEPAVLATARRRIPYLRDRRRDYEALPTTGGASAAASSPTTGLATVRSKG